MCIVQFSSNLVSSFWWENSNLVKVPKENLTFKKLAFKVFGKKIVISEKAFLDFCHCKFASIFILQRVEL